MEEIKEDNHVCVIATWHEKEEFVNITVHIDSMEISCDRNGIETGIDEVSAEFEAFAGLYDCVCKITDNLEL